MHLARLAALPLLGAVALALWQCGDNIGASCRTSSDCKASVCGFKASDGCGGSGHCIPAGDCSNGLFTSSACGCDGNYVEAWCSEQGFRRPVTDSNCMPGAGAGDASADACAEGDASVLWDAASVAPGDAYCIVRDQSTSLPSVGAPSVGSGYALTPVSASCIAMTRLACTVVVFEQLMREYCAVNREPVQWEVVASDGFRECAVDGCLPHSCPDGGLDGAVE